MLLELARHGHATERASQELFHNDLMETQRDGDLTEEKMSDLTYIDHLVKEVLRLTPPMGGGYRHVLRTMEIEVSSCSPAHCRMNALTFQGFFYLKFGVILLISIVALPAEQYMTSFLDRHKLILSISSL